MACDITKGLKGSDCLNNIAGLRALYIANYDEYEFVLSGDDTDGEVIATLPVELTEVFKFPLWNDGNDFTEESESNRQNSTAVWNQTLNFVIDGPNAVKQFQIKNLVWGRPLIFVEDNQGQIFLMGKEFGAEVDATTTIEGEKTGAKNYQMVAIAQEREPIAYLDESAITALKALVPA